MKKQKIIYILIMLVFLATASFAEVVDFIVANGRGPYMLANTNPTNVNVSLAKKTIDKSEYNLDEEKATIFFFNPIDAGKIIKVSYETANNSKATPTTDLTSNSKTKINMNTYNDSANQVTAIGADLSTAFIGGDFTADVVYKNKDTKDFTDNIAGKLGYAHNFGKLKLGATYSVAGDDVDKIKNYEKGTSVSELLLSYNENNINLDSKYVASSSTTDKVTFSNKLLYSPNKTLKINVGYNNEQTNNNLYTNENIDYSIENQFKNMYAKFYGNIKQIDTTTSTDVQKLGAEVGNNTFKMAASTEDTTVNDQKTTVQIAKAELYANSVKIAAATNDTITNNQITNVQSANAQINGKNMSVTTGVEETNVDNTRTNLKNTISSNIKVIPNLEFTGNFTENNGIDTKNTTAEAGIKYTLGQKLGISSNVKSVTNNSNNPLLETNTTLTFTPDKYNKYVVIYKGKDIDDDNEFQYVKLTGNYILDRFNLYTAYVKRLSTVNDYEDTKQAKLCIKPFNFLELNSQYIENPEDGDYYKNNIEYGYGVNIIAGDINLTSDLYESKGTLDYHKNQKINVGIKAKVFGGSIFSNVIFENSLNTTDSFYRKYVLGYSKAVGKSFNLSVSGEYGEKAAEDKNFQQDNVKANLNLGVNF